jgi:hypothetical protein
MGAGSDKSWLDLADAIELLRDQVTEAQQRAAGHALRFVMGEVTLELEVELERSGSRGGGLRFGVVSADARGERSSRSSHRVTLALTPQLSGGADVEISDDGDLSAGMRHPGDYGGVRSGGPGQIGAGGR